MAVDERVQRLLVRLESDQQSATRTQADISRYLTSLEAVEQQQKSVDSVYNEARDTELELARARLQGERATRDGRDELARYNQEQREAEFAASGAEEALDRFARQQREAADATAENNDAIERGTRLLADHEDASHRAAAAERARAQTGGRGTLESLDRTSMVTSQVLSGIGASSAANIAGLGGDVLSAFTSLNPVMLAVSAAGIGLAAVLGDVERRFQEAKAAGEAFAQRSQAIAELAAGGATSTDVQQQVTNLEAARATTQSYSDTLITLRDRIRQNELALIETSDRLYDAQGALTSGVGTLSDADVEAAMQDIAALEQQLDALNTAQSDAYRELSDVSGGLISNLDALDAALADNQRFVDDATSNIRLYNNALNAGVFAHNDAAAAVEDVQNRIRDFVTNGLQLLQQYAEQQREARRQDAEDQANALRTEFTFRQQAAQLRDSGTMEQLRAIYRLNEQEQTLNAERIRRLTPLADASEAVAAEVAALTERQDELVMQNRILRESVEPIIAGREREAVAAQKLTEAVGRLMDATTASIDAQQKAGEALSSYNEAVDKFKDNVAQIALDLLEKEDALRAQAAAEQAESERRYAEQRLQAAEELQERLLEIEQQAARNYENARARRDVLGAIQALQQAQDEREREEKNAKKRIDDLDEQLEEQTRVQKQRLDEQLRVARDAANKALRQEAERANAEILLRYRAYQQSLVDLQNAEYARISIQQYYHGLMIQEAYNAGAAQVQAYRAGALAAQYQYAYAAGSPKDKYTTTAPVAAAGSHVTINVQGQTLRGVEKQVFGILKQIWVN